MTAECTADLGRRCDAGPDGEPCESCQEYEAASMADARRSYDVACLAERDPERYASEMRDAGRGHLLGDGR